MVQFYDPQQDAESKRRRRMAEELMKRGSQPIKQQEAGGFVIPVSPWDALGNAAASTYGGYEERKADDLDLETARKRQEMIQSVAGQIGTDPSAAGATLLQDPTTMNAGFDLIKEDAKNKSREKAIMLRNGGSYVDPDTGEIIQGGGKPLPVGALKLQDEALENLGGADYVTNESKRLAGLLDKGALDLGPVTNTISRLRNWTSNSSPTSQAYGDLNTTLEKMRNESLRLNKGVQTEGDAIRAMNEVVATRNDPVLMKQNLDKLQRINERAVALQKNRVNSVRQNYGAPQYDFNQVTGVNGGAIPPEVPTPGADQTPLTPAEKAELEQLRTRLKR